MTYLCCAETLMEQMPEADAEKHYEEYSEFTEGIRRSGQYLGCNRLLPPHAATTVRARKSKVSATDGPFAEAKDLNEAIQVASRIPEARIGCVAVRPIAEDSRTLRALGFVDPGTRHSTNG